MILDIIFWFIWGVGLLTCSLLTYTGVSVLYSKDGRAVLSIICKHVRANKRGKDLAAACGSEIAMHFMMKHQTTQRESVQIPSFPENWCRYATLVIENDHSPIIRFDVTKELNNRLKSGDTKFLIEDLSPHPDYPVYNDDRYTLFIIQNSHLIYRLNEDDEFPNTTSGMMKYMLPPSERPSIYEKYYIVETSSGEEEEESSTDSDMPDLIDLDKKDV